jgi:hypothetical protein
MLLAACAGLNAYIPVIGLALADRVSDSVDLGPPFDIISSTGGIVVLLFLLTLDLVIDKVPRLDHLNDLVNTALRPAAGMFLVMAATDGKGEVDEIVAMLIGLLIAGAVHTYKALHRVRITQRSAGVANPFVSLIEDAMCGLITLLALTLPWIGAAAAVASGFALAWVYRAVPNSLGGRRAPHAPPAEQPATALSVSSDEP